MMDKQPQHWTTRQLFEKEVHELKRRMGLPSKIVEADTPRNRITDNDQKVTGDQPTGFITKNAEKK